MTGKRMMVLPGAREHGMEPRQTLHIEDDWCARAGCIPTCERVPGCICGNPATPNDECPVHGRHFAPAPKTKRTCNRHNDCEQAEKDRLERHPGTAMPSSFHCHDDECEDCFGD